MMIKLAILRMLGLKNVLRLVSVQEKYFLTGKQKRTLSAKKGFYAQFIKPGDLCFDVGANLGNRITPLLALGARVVAVEPQENCCHFLRNKFGDKIRIVRSGLGETECVKNFYVSDACTLSSFSPEWIESVQKSSRFKDYSWDKTVQVEITTLDRLIERYGLPSFIKIDVEGYELEVLKGLTQPVGMISFEYTVPEQTSKISDCLSEIEKNNKNIECNYSVGENMFFALPIWVPPKELKELVQTQPFSDTGFGDIYVRSI